MMRNVLLAFILFSFFSGSSAWLHPARTATALPVPLERILLREFDKKRIDTYRLQKDFRYDGQVPLNENLLQKLWRKLQEQLDRLGAKTGIFTWLYYVVWATAVLVFVYLVLRISGLNLHLFTHTPKITAVPYREAEDNIHEIDFDQEIAQAIDRGNYRVAVRLYYLLSLKKLNERELISWQADKTNQVYLRELQDEANRTAFGRLTSRFEYVWYGGFGVEKSDFAQLKTEFDQFHRSL
ncbi:DUF4129 domain-containing protein [Pedobacter faecalis]|uniref:DUF4129 domain-containing protein n=1 Tax=Pedobacter faecalis TaxID=3041495 RepID=UPI00254F0C54|nr:DUF4129 domain-containing protein [Pedobacter sp. ELA7]